MLLVWLQWFYLHHQRIKRLQAFSLSITLSCLSKCSRRPNSRESRSPTLVNLSRLWALSLLSRKTKAKLQVLITKTPLSSKKKRILRALISITATIRVSRLNIRTPQGQLIWEAPLSSPRPSSRLNKTPEYQGLLMLVNRRKDAWATTRGLTRFKWVPWALLNHPAHLNWCSIKRIRLKWRLVC